MGDDHSALNHSWQEHSNASWGNHTETNKLLARVKELSAVLTQASPGEAVQRKLAGEAKHGLAAEAKHGLGEHEETDMAALLRRAAPPSSPRVGWWGRRRTALAPRRKGRRRGKENEKMREGEHRKNTKMQLGDEPHRSIPSTHVLPPRGASW